MICVWEQIIGDWELKVSCLVLVFIMIYSLGFIHTTLKSLKNNQTNKNLMSWLGGCSPGVLHLFWHQQSFLPFFCGFVKVWEELPNRDLQFRLYLQMGEMGVEGAGKSRGREIVGKMYCMWEEYIFNNKIPEKIPTFIHLTNYFGYWLFLE